MNLENRIIMNLQHFDGGAGGAAGGAATGSTGSATTTAATTGVSPANAEQGAGADEAAANDRREKWKATKAEYKDLYGEEVKSQVDDRLKKFKPLETEHTALTERTRKLMEMAGVDSLEALEAALSTQQQKRIEDEAYEKGMDPNDYRAQMEMQKKAAAYEQIQKQQAFARDMALRWRNQAAELQQSYPDFNIEALASTNADFAQMLRDGKSVKTAYEATHASKILAGMPQYEGFDFGSWKPDKAFTALLDNGFPIANAFESVNLEYMKQRTAQQMEKRVSDTIRSGKGRVSESGTSLYPGNQKPSSVSAMTPAERARLVDDFRTGKKNPRDYGM